MQVLEVSRLAQRPYSLSLSLSLSVEALALPRRLRHLPIRGLRFLSPITITTTVLLRKTDNDNSNKKTKIIEKRLQQLNGLQLKKMRYVTTKPAHQAKPP